MYSVGILMVILQFCRVCSSSQQISISIVMPADVTWVHRLRFWRHHLSRVTCHVSLSCHFVNKHSHSAGDESEHHCGLSEFIAMRWLARSETRPTLMFLSILHCLLALRQWPAKCDASLSRSTHSLASISILMRLVSAVIVTLFQDSAVAGMPVAIVRFALIVVALRGRF